MSIENEVKKLTAVTQQLVDAIVKHNLLIAGEDAAVLTANEPENEPEDPKPKADEPPVPAPTVEPAAGATSADLLKRRGRNKAKPADLPFEVPTNG